MSELRELFEMTTKQVEPDLEAWREQERRQHRAAARRKRGALLLAAMLALATTVIAIQVVRDAVVDGTTPAGQGTVMPTAEIHLIGNPSGIVEAGGSIWVSTYDGTVYRIDPATNEIVDRVYPELHACGDFVSNGDSIYVSGCQNWPPTDTVRIDAATGKEVGRWEGLTSPVFGGGRAWAFDGGAAGEVREVDPETGRVIRVFDSRYHLALGYAFDSLWVAGGPGIVRVDPNTGSEVASYPLPADMGAYAIHGKIGGFASAGGYVWVIAYAGDVYGPDVTDAALFRLDPTTGVAEKVLAISLDPNMSVTQALDPSGPGPEVYLDTSGDTVLVARSPDTVVGVDAKSGQVVATYRAPGDGATNVAATSDSVWIANYGDESVWRYDAPQS
jgi:hypothetical protein